MFVRSAVRSLAVLAVLSAPMAAQGGLGPYSPATAKYRITSAMKVAQTMMGQTNEYENNSNQIVSVALAKAAANLDVSLVLDSITITSTSPQGAPDVSSFIGVKYVSTAQTNGVVADGKLTDKAGAESKAPVGAALKAFLPKIKLGAKKGDSWTDTSTTTNNQGGIEVKSVIIATYTVAGDTTVGGAKGWKVTGTSAGKLSGKGNAQGADLVLEGDVKGTSTYVMSAGGVFLGQTGESEQNLTVTVESAGMVIPIVQKQTSKVEKLP